MPERRFNPPKEEDLLARTAGFQHKLEVNRKAGEERLLSGEFQPFKGFDRKTYSNVYAFGIELTPDSQARIIEQVTTPLHDIAKANGITAIFPGHGDLPPHVTFDAAKFMNIASDQKQQLTTQLDHNLYFNMICKILAGLDFTMDTLVLSPSSYICTGEFGEQMYAIEKARRLIERVFEQKKLESIDYRDIFHASVARITAIPGDKSQLIDFVKEAKEKVAKPLASSPINISATRAFHSVSYDDIVKKGGIIAP